MFYQPSASRNRLAQWVKDTLDGITFASPDRAYLDAITMSEILDLAYLEGADFSEAMGAHALFLPQADDAQRGYGAISSMEVTFPININEEHWGYELRLRGGRPSLLGIGQGARFPRQRLAIELPEPMHSPRIRGTQFELRETAGDRLRTVAGPLEFVEHTFTHTIREPSGRQSEAIRLTNVLDTYAYVDDTGTFYSSSNEADLQPLTDVPSHPAFAYLQLQCLGYTIHTDIVWERVQADLGRMTLRLYLAQMPGQSLRTNARTTALGSFVLPALQLRLHGAEADFPTQQYGETKHQFLTISDEERPQIARQRLYQVQQSGCIATRHPENQDEVTITTFGVFDTPREIPVPGPYITEVIASPQALLNTLSRAYKPQTAQFVYNHWNIISAVLEAAGAAFHIEHFRQFQWDAITTGLELEAMGRQRVTTIVRAPTSAGKTLVFMVNAAISALCGSQRSTSVLLFPTRLLNEDMFRRLMAFVYQLRSRQPTADVTGGIFMGVSDPLYKLLLKPESGDIMYQYGRCPECGQGDFIAQPHPVEDRMIPTCTTCRHEVTYMYNPQEVTAHLPDIVIATPDKLFFEATVSGYEMRTAGFFGSRVRRCNHCGRAYPEAWFTLKPTKNHCADVFKGAHCSGVFTGPAVAKPLRYLGFDEVHSLHGETVTYLSVFLSALESMERILTRQKDIHIRYETATATIANERELLEAITRRRATADEIIAIPGDETMDDYLTVSPDRIRHRVLLTMPARISSRDAMIRVMLNAYRHLRGPNPDLKEHLTKEAPVPDAWNFLLGYVFKRQDGLDLRRALTDFYQNRFDQTLNISFLSGMAPKNQISQIIDKARHGDLDMLLANLVVSLGVDIQDLNHMVMFGVPKSFTEYVQTAGRTGRGDVSGHVHIILLPNYPRDTYLYRHFHAVFSDVSGYYDALPVRSTNLHCSEEMFGNVAKGILGALCLNEPTWSHRAGVHQVTAGKGKVWEDRLRGLLVNILCDDPQLQSDTQQLVLRQYRTLVDTVLTEQGFLGEVMDRRDWLLRSLRGRSTKTVRLMCSDQTMLDLISGSSTKNRNDDIEED